MKIRNPKSRFDLKIGRNDFVLDVGGGHNPHPRANVVIDRYLSNNAHRCGDLKILGNQHLIIADGMFLPLKDKMFEYALSSHALEHVEKPYVYLSELSRVGKRGYLEVPSLIGEYLVPKKSHRWAILEIDEKIVLMNKQIIGLSSPFDFGDLWQKHVMYDSIEFNIFMRTHPNLFTIRYEWKDEINCVVDPDDENLRSFFVHSWDEKKILKIIPKKSKLDMIASFLLGFTEFIFDCAKYRIRYIFLKIRDSLNNIVKSS